MDNVWDGRLDTLEETDFDTSDRTGIIVNGSFLDVTPGISLKEKVKDVARQSGFGKFNVKLNGSPVDDTEVPNEFRPGDVVEISKYDTAG